MRQGYAANVVGLALALTVLLAGCGSKPPNPAASTTSSSTPGTSPTITLPPTINRTVDPYSLRPEMVDCGYFVFAAEFPRDEVARNLPNGYSPSGLVSAEASVNVETHQCLSFVINNETVVPNVSLVKTAARVSVNETLSKGVNFHYYLLELFVSNATVRDYLAILGFRAVLADLKITTGDSNTDFSVAVDGSIWYRGSGSNGVGQPSEDLTKKRFHQVSEARRAQWISENQTYSFPNSPGSATMTISGGILKTMRPGDTGMLVGAGEYGRFKASWSPNHL